MPSMSAEREAYDGTRCTFQPRNGGWSDRCREDAVLAVPKSPSVHTTFIERRCQRHYAIDVRTEAKRGWGSWQTEAMQPFDAAAERAAIIERVTAQEADRVNLFWAHCADAVTDRDLATLRDLVQRGRL